MSSGCLESEGLQYLTILSVHSIQDYQKFYTLRKWKESMWMKSSTYIKGYISMYMYTCKQSLHESSCCKVDKRHYRTGLQRSVCVCALVPLRDALRDTKIFFRVFSTLHPLALRQVKSAACSICFSRLEFIFEGFLF